MVAHTSWFNSRLLENWSSIFQRIKDLSTCISLHRLFCNATTIEHLINSLIDLRLVISILSVIFLTYWLPVRMWAWCSRWPTLDLDFESFLRCLQIIDLLYIWHLHLTHSPLHIKHFFLLLLVCLFEHLSFGQLTLSGLASTHDLLCIAHISLSDRPICFTFRMTSISLGVLLLVVHRVLPATILSLIVELGLVVGAIVLHLWMIHVSLLLLLLLAHGRFLLTVFHYKL